MSSGWNATSYQILNPRMQLWFADANRGVVGYIRRGHMLLAAGAPICPPEFLPAICRAFEAFARRQNCAVCYVCAEERLRKLLPGHAVIALGAQPVWDPKTWPETVRGSASLRAQLSRCRNKGVTIEAIPGERAARDPELRRVLRDWLRARPLPTMHFLAEPDALDGDLTNRVILAATRYRRPVAFLVASPVAARNGYLVELLARSPDAPNGVSELLIDAAMRRFALEGREYVTLGLVAMAGAAKREIGRNPLWLRALMEFARVHGNHFYNFRGLEQFRVKMAPRRWDPVFAISSERRFSPATLFNLGSAFFAA